ncbi:MAG: MBL fold metallo-hydrolase [Treponema sp.]|jgi:L-ascorbate metabolism protein UlaG (beta-lactamase superfamily)|nr:MBL fold metallo-hydrolase [Treponema sp.]
MGEANRWYKAGDALLRELRETAEAPGAAFVWFLGQMGFAVQLKGLVFYFDVILNDFINAAGTSSRVYPPPFEAAAVQRVDYVLCTHEHGDHLNLATLVPLAKANPQARFIVPMPLRGILTEKGGIEAGRVFGVREGEDLALPRGLSLSPVAAAHPDYERDENGDDRCLGYVLSGGGIGIYHAGDTMVTPRLVDSLKARGPLDICMLPINGADWERSFRGIVGNMSPLDAVKLIRAIDADLVIPGHYDMMAGNSENPAAFTNHFYALCPEKRHHLLALGERFCYLKS